MPKISQVEIAAIFIFNAFLKSHLILTFYNTLTRFIALINRRNQIPYMTAISIRACE